MRPSLSRCRTGRTRPTISVADMDSRAHHACTVVGHHLAQKLEEPCDVKRSLFMFHNSPLLKFRPEWLAAPGEDAHHFSA